jgi:hypothetical protein
LGPDPHKRTPDPYTYKSRAPKKARQVPWRGPSPPPREVRALARSRDGKDPGMRGSGAGTCPGLSRRFVLLARGLRHKPTGQARCKAHKVVQPLHLLPKGRAACHHANGRRALQHLMCPVQSNGRRRQGHPVGGAPAGLLTNSAPVLSGALYSSSLLQEASPAYRGYEDLGCQGTRRLHLQQTFVAPSTVIAMSLGPHVGAQYLCACPPSAIKGEACSITGQIQP